MLKSRLLARLRKSGFIRKGEVNSSLLNEISSAPPLIEFSRLQESIQSKGRLMLPSLLAGNSIGLELGVAAGYFSDALLDSQSIRELYSLDAWGDHHTHRKYTIACNRLSRLGTKSVLYEDTSRPIDKIIADFRGFSNTSTLVIEKKRADLFNDGVDYSYVSKFPP